MLVSVIVPVHNAEKSIELCLNSIVSQTYSPIEIVIFNDNRSGYYSVYRTVEVTTVGDAFVNVTVPPKELSKTPRVFTPLVAFQ